MKKIFIILCLTVIAASCGKKDNKVSSGTDASGANGLDVSALTSFPGEYEVVQMDSRDCSATIRIVSECNGIKILTNGYNPPEEFCNVNRGTFRSDVRDDRNPPNPGRAPTNQEMRTVTLQGNQLTAVLKISESISFTNTLTLNPNGLLIKVSNLKSRTSRCVYKKI